MNTPHKSGRFAQPNEETKRRELADGPGSGIVGGERAAGGGEEWPVHLTARDAAAYVHEMAIELKALAESAKLSFLAYLLALVIEESALHKRGRL